MFGVQCSRFFITKPTFLAVSGSIHLDRTRFISDSVAMLPLSKWFKQQSSWIESQQVSILSAAFIIVLANIASAASGLVKNRVISSVYITEKYGNLLDAYWVAFRLPDFIYQILVLGLLSAAFVPLFSRLYKQNKDTAFALANQTLYATLGIFGLIALIVALFTRQFVGFITGPEFSPDQFEVAVRMTRIMLISQVLFAISGFFSAMLQSARRFVIPAFTPVFYNLGIILTVFLGTYTLGLYAAAWGTVVGALLHMLIQVPLLWKLGFRWKLKVKWQSEHLKEIVEVTIPRTLTLVINQLHLFVLTFFATSLGNLSLTVMTFAQQLMTMPIRFFGVSIGQAALPFLAASHDNELAMRRMVFRSIRQIVFFTAPASALLLVLRVPVVRLAFGTDEFPWRTTLDTAMALGILSLSVMPQAVTHLLLRAFYARNNTRTPLLTAIAYSICTLVLSWFFVYQIHWGIAGLATALSLAATFETLSLLLLFLRAVPGNSLQQLWWSLFRLATASILMAVVLFVFQRLFDLYVFETSRTWQLIQLTAIVSTLGAAVYIGLCWLLGVEELTILQRLYEKVRHQWRRTISSSPDFVETVASGVDTTDN